MQCIGRGGGGAKERFQLQDILVGLNQRLNHERWLKSRPSSIAAAVVCLPIMLELVLFMRMKSVPIKFRSFLPTIDARSAGFRCIMAAGKAGLILRDVSGHSSKIELVKQDISLDWIGVSAYRPMCSTYMRASLAPRSLQIRNKFMRRPLADSFWENRRQQMGEDA